MGDIEPLVSVNLTTYNRAHLLHRAIKSVLNQAYKNLEIIIVDDGSDDNTYEVLENLGKNDNRINYIKHAKNRGNAAARNTALKNSSGEYIAFMDDDDEWIDPHKIEKQISIFLNSNDKLGIVCSNVRVIFANNTYKERYIDFPRNLRAHILKHNGIIYSPTVMTKRKLLEALGGFDENLKRGIDSDFYRSCIIRKKCEVYLLEDITTNIYERKSDRITIIDNKEKIIEAIKAHLYLIKKYLISFIFIPRAFSYRLKLILKLSLKYIKTII